MSSRQMNREAWLRRGYKLLRRKLVSEAPERVGLGVGFPSSGGKKKRSGRVVAGECWHDQTTTKEEGGFFILISPAIADPIQILDILLHEMIHAATPGEGHGKKFSQMAKRCGLEKPWTGTKPGPELKESLVKWVKQLGEWPKVKLVVKTKQGCRQMKLVCPCGRILRGAMATITRGDVICGVCNKLFKLK